MHGVVGYLFIYPSTAFHELGHALAGLAVGVEITKIEVGLGKEMKRIRIWGTEFIFSTGFGGFTYPGRFPNTHNTHIKLRLFILSFGGPLADLTLAMALVLAMDSSWSNHLEEHRLYVPHVLLITQLYETYRSIWPRQWSYKGYSLNNDGADLISIPFYDWDELDYAQAGFYLSPAMNAFEKGDFAESEDICREGLKFIPDSMYLKQHLACALIASAKGEEARRILEKALLANIDPRFSAYLHANLAAAWLLEGSQAGIRKALEHTEKSFEENEIRNNHDAIVNKAFVLIEEGKVDEGIAILEKSVDMSEPIRIEENCVSSHAYLAYGYLLKGNREGALKLIERIESKSWPKSGFDSVLLARIIEHTNNFGRSQRAE